MNAGFRWMTALLIVGCTVSCNTDLSKYNPNYGKVELVEAGWTTQQVIDKIGTPDHMILGKGLQISWREMVYPHGSVFLYRWRVQKVTRRDYLASPEKDEDPMLIAPFKEGNIFEKEKKSPARSDRVNSRRW